MYNPNEGMTMEEIFHKYLPHTLYQSHYALSEEYGFTPQEWRKFLRDNNLFIESELSAIAEAEARAALSKLANANGTEVQALKAILEKSKLINDAQKQNTKVVLTFMPSAHNHQQPPIVSSLPEPAKPKQQTPTQPQPSLDEIEERLKQMEENDPYAGF